MKPPDYKNRMRIRVCGLLKKSDKILMVQLKSPVTNELVWMLPGGGLQFGEPMKDGLKREFSEETGLTVEPGDLFAVNEVIQVRCHAIECYFNITGAGGEMRLGNDPEYGRSNQILKDLQWVAADQLMGRKIAPEELKKWVRQTSDNNPNFYSQTT